jgi:hypothetical protein
VPGLRDAHRCAGHPDPMIYQWFAGHAYNADSSFNKRKRSWSAVGLRCAPHGDVSATPPLIKYTDPILFGGLPAAEIDRCASRGPGTMLCPFRGGLGGMGLRFASTLIAGHVIRHASTDSSRRPRDAPQAPPAHSRLPPCARRMGGKWLLWRGFCRFAAGPRRPARKNRRATAISRCQAPRSDDISMIYGVCSGCRPIVARPSRSGCDYLCQTWKVGLRCLRQGAASGARILNPPERLLSSKKHPQQEPR